VAIGIRADCSFGGHLLSLCRTSCQGYPSISSASNHNTKLNLLFAAGLAPFFGGREFVGNLEVNAAVQCAIEGAPHGIRIVDLLDHTADVLGRCQSMVNENPANDKYAILGFHFATHCARQSSATCLDVPRCQRGGKRAL